MFAKIYITKKKMHVEGSLLIFKILLLVSIMKMDILLKVVK